MQPDLIPAWDRNELLSTIEMGGISPGYEQAIQVACFETIREILNSPSLKARFDLSIKEDATEEEKKDYAEVLNDALMRAIEKYGKCLEGLSGAQASVSGSIAGMYLHYGHKGAIEKAREQGVEDDRFIFVRKEFP